MPSPGPPGGVVRVTYPAMDVTHIIEPLNDAQRAAVTAPEGHALVLAGAGSGKTRVLVHRVAWLLATRQVSPFGILAVTFTNKAAGEMRGRIEEMLGHPVGGMWVGTFHGLAHRLLRLHASEAGLPEGFQIIDSEDQQRLVRRILRRLELDEGRWPPRQVQGFINARKEEGRRSGHLGEPTDPWARQMARLYREYEEACRQSGLVDFAELLLRAHELLRDNDALREHYRSRFRHILVDEFQDTNAIQYAWIRLLAGDAGLLFAVGDDDQSIYGWRGARVENMRRLGKDFPGLATYRLEQNYRSTANILSAANALIAHNPERLGKNLWTRGQSGEPLHLYRAFNDVDEARFIVSRIAAWVDGGGRRDEVAILYRVSAQSRVLEEALLGAGIPYRVHGGLRFYERAEIKDALAYLRLTLNRDDDAAFERVVNTPTRGIGARTLEVVRGRARREGTSLWRAAAALVREPGEGGLPARAAHALGAFLSLIDESLGEAHSRLGLEEQVAATIEVSGLVPHYRKEKGEKGEARIENLQELVTAARQFEERLDGEDELAARPLTTFLAHAALEAGEMQAADFEDGVQMMTLHAAKGLEFPLVFLCGMEEGLFPHQRSSDDPARLEEERRLCYVGMTRAKRQLVLSFAESRRLHGADYYPGPSRFLREIPSELVEEVRFGGGPRPSEGFGSERRSFGSAPGRGTGSGPGGGRGRRPPGGGRAGAWGAGETAPGGLQLGQRVAHARFGEGVVLGYEGDGPQARVQVNFERAGSKWLVLAYANLQAL